MNKFLVAIAIISLAVAAYFIGTSFSSSGESNGQTFTLDAESAVMEKPERKAEVYGKVTKLEGNLVTIAQIDTSANPTAEMSQEEKRSYMQSLSEEERTALKDTSASATLSERQVLIPVGIPMTKKPSTGPDTPEINASLADVSAGTILSVWLNQNVESGDIAEFVKVSSGV